MKITNLTKKFGKKIVFSSLTTEISDKGITAIKGASGYGKTTLLRIIAGLDKKFSGQIDLGEIKKISYVFQEPRLLDNLTALENVMLVLDNSIQSRTTATKWLCALGLENDLNTYPDEMSGGMKQRVSIARALAFDGDLLLLDEAFNGIDEQRTIDIMDIIIDFAEKKPCVVVSHNQDHLDYLKVCKTIEL